MCRSTSSLLIEKVLIVLNQIPTEQRQTSRHSMVRPRAVSLEARSSQKKQVAPRTIRISMDNFFISVFKAFRHPLLCLTHPKTSTQHNYNRYRKFKFSLSV